MSKITAQRPGFGRRTFTADQWDKMGPDKWGWVITAEIPAEVKAALHEPAAENLEQQPEEQQTEKPDADSPNPRRQRRKRV